MQEPGLVPLPDPPSRADAYLIQALGEQVRHNQSAIFSLVDEVRMLSRRVGDRVPPPVQSPPPSPSADQEFTGSWQREQIGELRQVLTQQRELLVKLTARRDALRQRLAAEGRR